MIRDATESDLPNLAAAMVRLQDAHVKALPDFYRRFDIDDAIAHMSGLLSQSNAFLRVVVHDVNVVGHVVLLIETRPANLFTHEQRFGHIAQIEVEPDFRRKGYGRLLLADCERIATLHGLHRIGLEVWAFNSSAKMFFYGNGYSDFSYKMSRAV